MPHVVERQVKAQAVNKGDRLNDAEGPIVEGRDWKTKYVYVNLADSRRPVRFEVDELVTVWREEPTDEEKLARGVERTADSIRRKAIHAFTDRNAVRVKLGDELKKDPTISYWTITALLEADAYAEVWMGLVNRVRHDLQEKDASYELDAVPPSVVLGAATDEELIAIVRDFRKYYVDQVVDGHGYGRGLSRSTGVIANAMEDVAREALGKFMNDVRWAGLDFIGE